MITVRWMLPERQPGEATEAVRQGTFPGAVRTCTTKWSTAPDIAGKGIANPIARFFRGMCAYPGREDAARQSTRQSESIAPLADGDIWTRHHEGRTANATGLGIRISFRPSNHRLRMLTRRPFRGPDFVVPSVQMSPVRKRGDYLSHWPRRLPPSVSRPSEYRNIIAAERIWRMDSRSLCRHVGCLLHCSYIPNGAGNFPAGP